MAPTQPMPWHQNDGQRFTQKQPELDRTQEATPNYDSKSLDVPVQDALEHLEALDMRLATNETVSPRVVPTGERKRANHWICSSMLISGVLMTQGPLRQCAES